MSYSDELCKAKEILKKGNYTFVLTKRGQLLKTSYERGVLPMLRIVKDDEQALFNAIVADKIIGRAAAFLLIKYRAKAVYADKISEKAREVLDKNSVFYQFGESVPFIKNRDQSGQCPLEKLTSHTDNPDYACEQISLFYKQVLGIEL